MPKPKPDQLSTIWLHRICRAIGTERLEDELELFAAWMRKEGPLDPLVQARPLAQSRSKLGNATFEQRLEHLRNEVNQLSAYVYSENAVQHAASKSKTLLGRLNVTAQFWLSYKAACETASFITLGRLFDRGSYYSVMRLVDQFEESLPLFQRPALEARKMKGQATRPEWLDEYLDSAHYPTLADVARIRRGVATYERLYTAKFKKARNKFYAHRDSLDSGRNNKLFQDATYRDLWRLTTFLIVLYDALWNQLENGRKILLRPKSYTIGKLYTRSAGNGTREYLIRDVRVLMQNIECAPTWERQKRIMRRSRKRVR